MYQNTNCIGWRYNYNDKQLIITPPKNHCPLTDRYIQSIQRNISYFNNIYYVHNRSDELTDYAKKFIDLQDVQHQIVLRSHLEGQYKINSNCCYESIPIVGMNQFRLFSFLFKILGLKYLNT